MSLEVSSWFKPFAFTRLVGVSCECSSMASLTSGTRPLDGLYIRKAAICGMPGVPYVRLAVHAATRWTWPV
eukprot:11189128-Prorocentrum_lima.AAC.1